MDEHMNKLSRLSSAFLLRARPEMSGNDATDLVLTPRRGSLDSYQNSDSKQENITVCWDVTPCGLFWVTLRRWR
jgi:hypothetical protein